MLQVARLAPSLLAEAAPRVVEFLQGEIAADGGGCDRSGKSDLYYTAFVLDALIAMRSEPDKQAVGRYLANFGDGEELDLVHRACLVRCWTALGLGWPSKSFREANVAELERHRSADGGYAGEAGCAHGTLYHAFLALGVYQDLGLELPDAEGVRRSFEGLRSEDGAYANARDLPLGTTPSTAAAAAFLRQMGQPVPPEVGPWLLAQQHGSGGFMAMPKAPMPDLLSTATALHALSGLGISVGSGRDAALDFVDTLWNGQAFYGHWSDDAADAEYTFYALLALGHLSVLG